MRDAHGFWRALERRLPEVDRDREREIACSVLLVLRSRIQPEHARDLEGALPAELEYLWTLPGVEPGTRITDAALPLEYEYEDFVTRVRELAHLSGIAEAARATCAVFGALCEVMPEQKARDLERQLSPGLQALWRGESWPGRAVDAAGPGDGR